MKKQLGPSEFDVVFLPDLLPFLLLVGKEG